MKRLRQRWQTLRSVARSLRIYYGDRGHRKAMRILYGRFIRRDDLVFDIGAHVGDRIAAFRRLGARVVAVEPQPALVTTLRILYGRDRAVTIEPIALASSPGTLQLQLNLDNPTVATGSHAFVQAAYGAPGWEGEKWTKTIDVPAITVDALIERHGKPAFIKLDVEGLEADVIAGLSYAVPALSFEFTTLLPQVARSCVLHCANLGYARYNAILGEKHSFVHSEWLTSSEIAAWLSSLPLEANSGDIYAIHESGIRNRGSDASSQ